MTRGIRSFSMESAPQWQTIYCSLMLLLLVLFLMLISYSAIDQERWPQIKNMTSPPDMAKQSPEMDRAMQAMTAMAHDAGMNDQLSIERTAEGFKAVIPNPVLFASGDTALNRSVYAVMDGIIKVAQRNQLAIQIEGHTDDVPINTAAFPSNWELSTMRAVNILRYLQKHGGIPANRLSAVGYAEYRPVASNDTDEGRRSNRRIEILFRPEK